MSLNLFPCIWHNHTAHEASDYYLKIFPNASETIQGGLITKLEIGDQSLLLLNGGNDFTPNSTISLFYYAPSAEEAKKIFDQLKEGGKVMMDFGPYDFAKLYAFVEDKYHTSWQIYWGDYRGNNATCLMFTDEIEGKANNAIQYYLSVFKNSRLLSKELYPESTGKRAGYVMFSEIQIDNFHLNLMDSGVDQSIRFTEGNSIVVECNDQEEIDHYWYHLSKDGEEQMCGWCKDQFGISWQIIPKQLFNYLQTPAAVEAFMSMKKINIEQLLNAK